MGLETSGHSLAKGCPSRNRVPQGRRSQDGDRPEPPGRTDAVCWGERGRGPVGPRGGPDAWASSGPLEGAGQGSQPARWSLQDPWRLRVPPPEGARLPSPITPHVSGSAGFGAVTAGSPRGARALPAVWPPRRTPPARCRPGPGGAFREYPDRIAIEGGQGRPNDRQGAPGTPTASRRGPELAAQGPEGCRALRG